MKYFLGCLRTSTGPVCSQTLLSAELTLRSVCVKSCVRQEAGYCSIAWKADTADTKTFDVNIWELRDNLLNWPLLLLSALWWGQQDDLLCKFGKLKLEIFLQNAQTGNWCEMAASGGGDERGDYVLIPDAQDYGVGPCRNAPGNNIVNSETK